jgi:hypothetical protein
LSSHILANGADVRAALKGGKELLRAHREAIAMQRALAARDGVDAAEVIYASSTTVVTDASNPTVTDRERDDLVHQIWAALRHVPDAPTSWLPRMMRARRSTRRTTARRVTSFGGGKRVAAQPDDGGGGDPPHSATLARLIGGAV